MSEVVTLRSASDGTIDLVIETRAGHETWGPEHIQTLMRESDTGTLQLLEEVEYEFTVRGQEVEEFQPSEIFDLSNSKSDGRVRPRGRIGMLQIDLLTTSGKRYAGEVEVRSRKLDYKTEYRWMLDRIANEATELALAPFSASRLSSLEPDYSKSPETLYQRFEFLRARLDSEEFTNAIEELRYRPHTSFEDGREIVAISRPLRGSRGLVRELLKPGPRVTLDNTLGQLTSLPRTIELGTHYESVDTVPNQFIRNVVEGWLALLDNVQRAFDDNIGSKKTLPSEHRARRELSKVRARLDEVMRLPAVRDAGRLTQFPSSNTVIRSRAGYREFLAAFQATNALAYLRWDQDDELISAGQHDVPTLYEYWVFLEVVRIIDELPDFHVNKESLVSVSNNGLSLRLRKANEVVVRASGTHGAVPVDLELWFNKSFSYSSTASVDVDRSWTVRMRPDVSLSILPSGIAPPEKTWIHFDAKYKVKHYTDGFANSEHDDERSGQALPADIQKMHSYRDAIRRSAGAYVIYPGDERIVRNQYHELLPGLGAFAMRPSSSGEADYKSSSGVRDFILNVIEHLAAQGTAYRRDRYWQSAIHEEPGYLAPRRSFLESPPSDTPVLLGYMRSKEHQAAVHYLGIYNLRADAGRDGSVDVQSEELGAKLVVLYGQGSAKVFRTSGDVLLRRKADLDAEGYLPSGELYLCLPLDLEPLMELDESKIEELAARQNERLDRPTGTPVSVSWSMIEPDRKNVAN